MTHLCIIVFSPNDATAANPRQQPSQPTLRGQKVGVVSHDVSCSLKLCSFKTNHTPNQIRGFLDIIYDNNNKTDRRISLMKIYHTDNRLRSFLSPSHSVTRSLGHLVTRSLGHSVTWSLGHSVTWSLFSTWLLTD